MDGGKWKGNRLKRSQWNKGKQIIDKGDGKGKRN